MHAYACMYVCMYVCMYDIVHRHVITTNACKTSLTLCVCVSQTEKYVAITIAWDPGFAEYYSGGQVQLYMVHLGLSMTI